MKTRLSHRLAEIGLFTSLAVLLAFLAASRPALPFYALPLIPVAGGAMLFGLSGGIFLALLVVIATSLILGLQPDSAERAEALRNLWPLVVVYLSTGTVVGWLATREHEKDRRLIAAAQIAQGLSRQLAAINTAGREIAASLDLDQTLRLVMEKAAATLPMDAGALFRLDPESNLYRVAAGHQISAELIDQIAFEFNQGVPGWVFDHRVHLSIPDASADPRVHPAIVQDGVRSVLSLPLIVRDQVVGVLNLYSRDRDHAFDDQALQLARVFADQAAVAIANARLVGELRQLAGELEARVEQRTAALRASQAQAIRSEKLAAAGRLAGSVAHEVNNPLQAVLLQADLVQEDLRREACVPTQALDRLEIVQKEVSRISEIVQRLLDFERPSQVHRSPIEVDTLLDDVLALARKQLQNGRIALERSRGEDLPPVLAEGSQIKQVFLNLVLNAADAMPRGGQLRVNSCVSNGRVAVTFSDDGVGMPQEVLDQLFEPFFTTKHQGVGLGLAISHDIVVQHGGFLEVESAPGAGTTFRVLLPQAEEVAA